MKLPHSGARLFAPGTGKTQTTLSTTVEAVILSDAPVATPLHRLSTAGALAKPQPWCSRRAYGIFLIAFFECLGGEFTWNKTNLLSLLVRARVDRCCLRRALDSCGHRFRRDALGRAPAHRPSMAFPLRTHVRRALSCTFRRLPEPRDAHGPAPGASPMRNAST